MSEVAGFVRNRCLAGRTILTSIRLLKKALPLVPVILISGSCDSGSVLGAIKAGVSAYLLKPLSKARLERTASRVVAGTVDISPPALTILAKTLRDNAAIVAKDDFLSQREQEIMARVAVGEINKQIGNVLGIGTATVRTHLRRIFKKLGVGFRKAAVAKFLGL